MGLEPDEQLEDKLMFETPWEPIGLDIAMKKFVAEGVEAGLKRQGKSGKLPLN